MSGGDRSGALSIARDVGRRPSALPCSAPRAGLTKSWNETNALTGLPGSVRIGVLFLPITPNPCGIPGCIATLRNLTVPSC